MAIKRITHVQAYDMSNKELIYSALDLAYQVGEVTSDAECLDYAASMGALLTEIKWRAAMNKFTIEVDRI